MTLGEVVRAALFRNELQARLGEVALRTAKAEHAALEDTEADEAAVDAMVEQFRVDNDLISGEETESWLESRGIDADDLQDHFTLCYWGELFEGEVISKEDGRADLTADLLAQLEVDVLISGALSPLAVALSRRMVTRAGAETRPDPAQTSAQRADFLERTGLAPEQVRGWLTALERDTDWLDQMVEMEASYRAVSEAVLTSDRLSRALAAMRLPLTRLEMESVEFDSIDAAREGLLCVRDDNLSLEEVAHESRFPFKRMEVWANELPEDQRQKLLCAAIGQIQDPSFSDGVFHLNRVIRRSEPTLENPTVRASVEQKIMDSHFSEARSLEVSWLLR